MWLISSLRPLDFIWWVYPAMILLTMAFYGFYRLKFPQSPKHHKKFIVPLLAVGLSLVLLDVLSDVRDITGVLMAIIGTWGVYAVIGGLLYVGIQRLPEHSREKKLAMCIPVLFLCTIMSMHLHNQYERVTERPVCGEDWKTINPANGAIEPVYFEKVLSKYFGLLPYDKRPCMKRSFL